MRRLTALAVCSVFAAVVTSCTSPEKKGEQDLKRPIHCATAEGDIRSLQHEKTHVAQQIAAGVKAITPIGLVAGVATGTEGKKIQVATGEYNKQIDDKIAEIKAVCKIK